jgi:hypothetical protein
MFTNFPKSIWAVEPRELSLFYAITYIAATRNKITKGTASRLIAVPDGAQESESKAAQDLSYKD